MRKTGKPARPSSEVPEGVRADAGPRENPSPFGSSDGVLLGVLIGLAIAVRILYYVQSLDWPYLDQPVSDGAMYLSRAQGVLEGTWPPPHTAHSQSPLYPYLIAGSLLLTGGHRFLLLIQLALGCASVGLVYGIARRGGGRIGGVVAAGLCLGYGPIVSTEGKLLTEPIGTFLSLLAAYWTVGMAERLGALPEPRNSFRTAMRGGAAGLCLGLASGLRPSFLLAVPLLAIWMGWRGRRGGKRTLVSAGVFCGSAAAVIAPFTWHNLRAEGDLIALSSAGGITFYLGNNPTAAGTLSLGGVITGEVATQHEEQLSMAEQVLGRRLTSGQASAFWYKRGLTFIRKHPRWWAWILWRKFRLYFSNDEVANVYAFSAERQDIPILRWLALPFGVIAALGLVGLVLSAREHRAEPILLLFGVGFLSCMVFYTSSRFRLPMVPLLAVLGGWGMNRMVWWYGLGSRRRLVAAGLVVVVLAGLMALPVGGDWPSPERFGRRQLASMFARNGQVSRAMAVLEPQLDPNIPAPDRAEAYLVLGRIEMEQRRYPQAVEALEAARRLNPENHAILRDLAFANHELGRYAQAVEYARTVLRKNPRYVACRLLIGDSLVKQRKWSEAIEELSAVRALEPQNVVALSLLGQAYAGLHQYDRAAEHLNRLAELRPEPAVLMNLAFCLVRVDRKPEARRVLARVLAADPHHAQAKAMLAELGGLDGP